MSLLGVGSSGLAAAYAAINATSNNIANVNTPGYSRQNVVQTTMPGQFSSGGFFGRGVTIESVRRAFDAQVNGQVQFSEAQSAEAATQSRLMRAVDELFATDDVGMGNALDNFFSSMTQASSRPSDIASRAAVISSGLELASRLNQASSQVDEQGRNVDLGIRATVVQINSLAQKIGRLNDAISLARGSGQMPNDLLDQRDEVVRQLNTQVGVSTLEQSDGSLNVFVSSGAALVVGNTPASMSISFDPTDPQKQLVGLSSANGATTINLQLSATSLNGGALAGQMKFRDINLVDAKNELGRLATAIASTFNAIHAAGTNMNGAAGQALFTLPAPVAMPSALNTGTGAISVSVAAASGLKPSDYRIDYNGSQYTITRLQDGTKSTTAALPVTLDGIAITLTGTPAAGDSFQLQPVRNAAAGIKLAFSDPRTLAFGLSNASGDNRNALALAAVAEQVTLGGLTFSQALGEISAKVGATARGLETSASIADKLLTQARSEQSSVSGVNLDEEAAKLIRYQQAYQASAKVIATAQTLFQTLIDMGR
ncbi:MAG: flagellar hook-associated protein FlgK [Rhodocyclaceae bacterium]|nr:flagellar hook-associated protein FlgK [Rhodocyclaceae bacterium]MCA3021773.1 flagellar hook-associated protein FlgK [Rhodocyclaceae bacterium]MCA3026722.1 flagellar hook-associated protein FlgK [Rhodocyclaceae bacterium]MCA3030141.1 flagellar hook-associated protein FlgK [Rhodocyclaceae bacterium]MCA3031156.1 flagellar hook-associated protein FlgK [Rhodocyclaceae bacterium]